MEYAGVVWRYFKGNKRYNQNEDKVFLNNVLYLLQKTAGYFDYDFRETKDGMVSVGVNEEIKRYVPERDNIVFCNDIVRGIERIKQHIITECPEGMNVAEWLRYCAVMYRYSRYILSSNADGQDVVDYVKRENVEYDGELLMRALETVKGI